MHRLSASRRVWELVCGYRRWLLTLALGGGLAWQSWLYWGTPPPIPSDFSQLWIAARALVEGANPYDAVGPGRVHEWPFPLLYPLPAVVMAVPFSWFPLRVSDALFVGLGAALLGWALTRERFDSPQLFVFGSAAYLNAFHMSQWAPLMTAAALTPAIGFLLACKPTVGLALLAAYPSRGAMVGAAFFGAATVAIWPWWVSEWLSTLSSGTHITAPIARWGGPLILLALLRWRRPEARLLVAMACVPHTPLLYEAVPLFLIVRTFEEGLLLSFLTFAVSVAMQVQAPVGYEDWMAASGQWIVWLLYLPALVIVLRRGNSGLPAVSWVSAGSPPKAAPSALSDSRG